MNNGGNVPLGYYVDKATGKLAVDPETAPYVQELFLRYADGERLTVLQAEMKSGAFVPNGAIPTRSVS